MTGKAFIFSAPSGAGKTTIVHHILRKFPELEFSVSVTTREKRDYEVHGKDYNFITDNEFRKTRDTNGFLEYEEVYDGMCYGTLKSGIDLIWAKGHAVVFDVDVVGALNLKKYFGADSLSVFIAVKDLSVLEDRLTKRNTESKKTLEQRIEKALREMESESLFDTILVNNELETALKDAELLVTNFLKS